MPAHEYFQVPHKNKRQGASKSMSAAADNDDNSSAAVASVS
tara:strand:- start:132 stop:254 length:123 start_codon:yes stop_codon:yes gene_type:complete